MSTSDFGAGASLDDMVSGLLDQLASSHDSIVVEEATAGGGTVADSNGGVSFNAMGSGLLDSLTPAPTVGISTVTVGQQAAHGVGLSAASSGGGAVVDLGGGVFGTTFDIPTYDTVLEEDDVRGGKGGAPAGDDPTGANVSPGGPGTLLTLGTNPDGSHFFTGNRNVDAVLIGSKWGTTNLTYSFPTSGSNYNGANLRQRRRQPLPRRPRHAAAGGGARGLCAALGGDVA